MKSKKTNKSSGGASVPTIVCPEVKLPDYIKKRKNDNYDREVKNEKNKKSKEDVDFRTMFASVKELGATQLTGLAKKNHKEDRLTKLGAPPAKQPTMPFGQKMGILAGRKKREKRMILQAKQSGVVLAKKNKNNDDRKRVKKDKGFDVHTKRGVLHLKKDAIGR